MKSVESKVRRMRKEEAAYVAGIFDGEGCIGFYRDKEGRESINCSISNTSVDMLMAVQRMVGGGLFSPCYRKKENPKYKQAYRLYFRYNEVRDMLPQIVDYLIIKRDVAECVLGWLKVKQRA